MPAFFWAWGLWNLHYYAALDQWTSWGGGIALFAANTVWLVMLIHYSRTK